MTDLENLEPCPFCGSKIKHVESWAKSFNPPRLWHEWHHVENANCWIKNRNAGPILFSDEKPASIKYAVETWNARAQPQSLAGCLRPGNEPKSCQYEGKCLSESCNHHGKTWYGARMTLEAQDPNLLYPKAGHELCSSCGRLFKFGDTCQHGGCPCGGDV